jgi:glutathione S-transferase
MIKLYGVDLGSSLRNHWLLHELGVPYEKVVVNLREREHKKEPFLKLNPTGQVPVMVDDDFVLSESMAINQYLGEKFGPELLGENACERAEAWKWSIWAYLNLQKHFGVIYFQTNWAPEKDEAAIEKATHEVKPYLEILDQHLASHTHLISEKFTVADINAGVTIGYGVTVNFDLSPYKNITRWYREITSRTGYLKATGQTAAQSAK